MIVFLKKLGYYSFICMLEIKANIHFSYKLDFIQAHAGIP